MEDLPAIWGSNPLQQLIAPLPIYALTVVGHKTEPLFTVKTLVS